MSFILWNQRENARRIAGRVIYSPQVEMGGTGVELSLFPFISR